ncbi:uncharacterized protein I303_107541 [Kwoniella dejecticola CBS 10117]|uniref:PAC domain-containing protein n=1 Tax=Kwoniella dejecticola CBS 10117 TaxID=1296121 RepID=A0A1A5ZZZ8_9TREE|nr:uncharacterized protein I303_06946 [Kwoniella dejecticola CBS 10117]OBR83381.1 hypothetical protein I303_06946 [Kwoniella dejecticola CBS 10117]
MSITDAQESDEVWDLLDALEHFNSKISSDQLDEDEMASLEQALAYEPTYSPALSTASGGHLEQHVEVPHLPPLSETMLSEVGKGSSRTSEPISQGIHQGKEQTLLEMASKQRFEQLLQTHMGLQRFEEWVVEEGLPGSKQLLSYYKDLRAYNVLVDEVKAIGSGLDGLYFGNNGTDRQVTSLSIKPSVYTPSITSASLSIHNAQEEATEKLYLSEFKRFVTGKLTEQAKARLQFIPDHKKRGDLGEVFCIADPRLPDQPLVFISDAFCRLSEYSRDLLIGRNCRFLQGPETDRSAVAALRAAIEAGQEHCCLLLNYTRTGKPFWNLLNMIPLKGANGAVEYLLGAQIDVTSAMSGSKAFQNLQDLVQNTKEEGGPAGAVKFSPQLVKNVEQQLSRPLILSRSSLGPIPKQADVRSQSISYPGSSMVPQRKNSLPPNLTSPELGQEKKSTWLSKLKKGGPKSDIAMDSYSMSSAVASAPSIPSKMRDRMSTFSAAHAKLLVFDAKCGRIQYVTPPLLAYLRYPIRSHKDRLASSLLRMDILDLLTGETPTETQSILKSVRDIISGQSTHSVFGGLLLSPSGRDAPDHIADAVTASGKKYARSLLHLTPVKDRKDQSQMYIVVVG